MIGGEKKRLRMCKVLKGEQHAFLDTGKTKKLQKVRSIRDKRRWQDCASERMRNQGGWARGRKMRDAEEGSNLGRQSKLGLGWESEKRISSGGQVAHICGVVAG